MVIIRTACYRITQYSRFRETSGALVQPPLRSQGQTKLHRTMSSWAFSISRDGHSTVALRSLCQCLSSLTVRVFLLSFILFPLTSSGCISKCPDVFLVLLGFAQVNLCLKLFSSSTGSVFMEVTAKWSDTKLGSMLIGVFNSHFIFISGFSVFLASRLRFMEISERPRAVFSQTRHCWSFLLTVVS